MHAAMTSERQEREMQIGRAECNSPNFRRQAVKAAGSLQDIGVSVEIRS